MTEPEQEVEHAHISPHWTLAGLLIVTQILETALYELEAGLARATCEQCRVACLKHVAVLTEANEKVKKSRDSLARDIMGAIRPEEGETRGPDIH